MTETENVPENPPAFPFAAEYGHPAAHGGMSLRDWFAGQALQGQLATGEAALLVARCAYAIADAMLAARKDSQ